MVEPGEDVPVDVADVVAGGVGPVVGELDKWVLVDFVEPAAPGWAKVRHRDGTTGYVRSAQVWGL